MRAALKRCCNAKGHRMSATGWALLVYQHCTFCQTGPGVYCTRKAPVSAVRWALLVYVCLPLVSWLRTVPCPSPGALRRSVLLSAAQTLLGSCLGQLARWGSRTGGAAIEEAACSTHNTQASRKKHRSSLLGFATLCCAPATEDSALWQAMRGRLAGRAYPLEC